MNPEKRLLTYCCDQRFLTAGQIETKGDTAQLLRSLLLGDHVVMRSIHLREFTAFVEDLGIEAVIKLLESKSLTIVPDFVCLVVPGDNGCNTLPQFRYSLTRVNSVRDFLIPDSFAKLHSSVALSAKQQDELDASITAAFAPELDNFGNIAEAQTDSDIQANSPSLKVALAERLRRIHGFAIKPDDFQLNIHVEGGLFRADSNLPVLCRLSDKEVHAHIGMAMTAVGNLNVRLEEMQSFSSVSGFQEEDLMIFDARIRFLLERENCEALEQQCRRVISLLNLPEIPVARGRFDAGRFLEVRNTTECVEFRDWLSETSNWSDKEIIDRVGSFSQRVCRAYQSTVGKGVRFLVSTAAGLIPGYGTAAGLVAGALDTFLLDRLAKPSGPISFVSSTYPSLFSE